MNSIFLGIISGLIFGLLSVIIMLPMKFEDKLIAIIGSFINRFTIGFLISVTVLSMYGWTKGILIGLLISLPDALITKAYLPIIGIGIIGWLRW
ncbi:ascorbate-specific PTS system EIIC-type component UlaA [Peribacillus deserti]|uniref:Ascorbate-specific PTS system EIIC-type component UlaA n=1 Tax=Peribacillus deserti TaxID=673318 RepID=A0ABS2QIV3_9BACI|nr:ascorbate-specific PTS system EIIC-type component UlaA [Peribacillus deserti]